MPQTGFFLIVLLLPGVSLFVVVFAKYFVGTMSYDARGLLRFADFNLIS